MPSQGEHSKNQPLLEKTSKSVIRRLLSLLMVVLVPLFLIQGYIYYEVFEIRRTEELQANLEAARAISGAFDAFVKDVLRQNLAIGLALSHSPMPAEEMTELLTKVHNDYGALRALSWAGPDGRLIASSGADARDAGIDYSPIFREILSDKDWAVSDLILSRYGDDPVFLIGRAIYTERSGELLGVVLSTIRLDRLDEVLALKSSKAPEVSIVDSRGMLVYRSPHVQMSWEDRDLRKHPAIRKAIDGEEAKETMPAVEHEDKSRIVAATPIRSIGWVAAAGMREEEAIKLIISIIVRHGGMFLLSVTLAFIFAALASFRVICKPLTRIKGQLPPDDCGEQKAVFEEELRSAKEIADAARQEALKRDIELDAAISSISDGVIIIGKSKEILLINSVAAYFWNCTPETREVSLDELVKAQTLRTLDGKELSAEDHPIRRALQGETTVSLPLWVGSEVRQKTRCFSFSAAPVLVSGGKFAGAVATFSDITKQIQLTEELRSARDELELRVEQRTEELRKAYTDLKDYSERLEFLNKELREFAFVASHDLQEPLRKIMVLGDLVLARYASGMDTEGQDYLKRMQGSAARMSRLLQGLLDYSRVATRKNPYVSTDLNQIVRGVVNDLEILIGSKGATIAFAELPTIEADPVQMQQLFQNLIGNALKYSREDEKPLIRIYGEVGEGVAAISVEDNGIGFDEEYLDKIFRPLQRLHGKRSPYEGIGMGLAICRKIVERHSGSITARSEQERGAVFMIRLPVKQKIKDAEVDPTAR